MKIDLNGKTALVCGSSQGIGKATAIELANCGANVIALARNEDKLKELINNLSIANNQEHSYLACDFQQYEQSAKALEKFLSTRNNIDILINNAGGPAPGILANAEISEFISAFERHLFFSHLLVKLLTPKMKSNHWGRIINIISVSVRQPIDNLGISNTLRGAMASWSKTLSRELAQSGITVNNILPGFTDTERLTSLIQKRAEDGGKSYEEMLNTTIAEVPAKRLARPEEPAYLACFLASDFAGYITGSSIAVDGGVIRAV